MLNQAHTLIREEKTNEGKKALIDIVARYQPHAGSVEANKMLTALKVAEEIGNARANETWREGIQSALAAFRLDVGRYPTSQQGLKALVDGTGVKGWQGPYFAPRSADVLERFEYVPNGTEEPTVRLKPRH
jgi:hypothetical protein